MCLYPKIIENRKYKANKKNQGRPPTPTDERTRYVPVGCGKCMECKKQKARAWQVRLHEEIKHDNTGKFITLTFSNESITKLTKDLKENHPTLNGYELDNAIATLATRRFLERWRKKYKKSIKHWLITELGHSGTENIHIHGILFTNNEKEIEKIWQYGWIWIGDYVNEKTINYIIKYVNKTDNKHKEYSSKILTSSGIGKQYINTYNAKRNAYNENNTKETYTTRNGTKLNLPIYYRNKIYTEEEREKLWLQKLDKEERWVNGKKISIKNGEEEYYKTLYEERKLNKRLGYGDDEKNWERKKYEREKRILLHTERVKKGHYDKDDKISIKFKR